MNRSQLFVHSPPQSTASVLDSTNIKDEGTSARHEFAVIVAELRNWIEAHDFRGFEPFDLPNSPLLQHRLFQLAPLNYLFIQFGKRCGGLRLRRLLHVPPGRNPKALGLLLLAYCDLMRQGVNCDHSAQLLKTFLKNLRSPGEQYFCWGYDWNYVSLRGTRMPAFSMNAIATTFCGESLLDLEEITKDREALAMAESAAQALMTRLNRSVDDSENLCFSYTPADHTKIFNSSALTGAFLARVGAKIRDSSYLDCARRAMKYLVQMQRPDGSWFYGADRKQRWIDSFHSGYNIYAMLAYREVTRDSICDSAINRGYSFYTQHFFLNDGATKYGDERVYPIDIHACAHAIICLLRCRQIDDSALSKAVKVARWTLRHMRNSDGSFSFQKHLLWTNRTPYMRWGQAWMLHALVRLQGAI